MNRTAKILAAAGAAITLAYTSAVAIMTSHYSSDTVEEGDYYIPMRVDCVLADNEWKVLSSEWLCYAPVSYYELRKNEASGYYELYPVKEDDSIVE